MGRRLGFCSHRSNAVTLMLSILIGWRVYQCTTHGDISGAAMPTSARLPNWKTAWDENTLLVPRVYIAIVPKSSLGTKCGTITKGLDDGRQQPQPLQVPSHGTATAPKGNIFDAYLGMHRPDDLMNSTSIAGTMGRAGDRVEVQAGTDGPVN